ncbi:MAG: ABC transporter permease [Clostridia bacterium]|nr:ABC transporter permease [Clostridia bacterium]
MNILKAEWLKMKKKSIKVLIGLYGLMLIGLTFLYVYSETFGGLMLFNKGQFVSSSLKLMMTLVLPLVSLFMASSLFGSELQQGTIKNMLLLPIEKTQIFIYKIIAIIGLLFGILSLQFVYSTIISIIFDGWISFRLLGSCLLSYFGALLVLGLIASIGAVLTLIIKSNGLALLLGYFSYIVLGVLNIYFPILRPISLPTIMDQYHHLLFSGYLIQLLSIVAYYIMILSAGILIFDKKDDELCQFE